MAKAVLENAGVAESGHDSASPQPTENKDSTSKEETADTDNHLKRPADLVRKASSELTIVPIHESR